MRVKKTFHAWYLSWYALTCVEFARHVLNMEGANSTELDPDTKYPIIIDIMRDQIDIEDMGGTLCLGLYPCTESWLTCSMLTTTKKLFNVVTVTVMNLTLNLREQFEAAGFVFSGVSPDNRLMEVVELPEKKFFVAAQYHPELQSRPNRPEELYTAFVTAAIENSK